MNLPQFKTVEQLAAAIKTLDMVTSVPLTDYSGTSTIIGWTSYTEKIIEYQKIFGKLMFVNFRISGESDDTVATFTVPFGEGQTGSPLFFCRSVDDGGAGVASHGQFTAASIVTLYSAPSGAAWTNSGTKAVHGQFFYVSA